MITRATVDGFFAHMTSKGIDVARPMLWGYFFVDPDRSTLERARPALEALGYRFVTIFEREAGSSQELLHVERVEMHTASSLLERCRELDAFAAKHRIAAFDGFDMGNADGTPLKRGR